jgi:hypothetical protein
MQEISPGIPAACRLGSSKLSALNCTPETYAGDQGRNPAAHTLGSPETNLQQRHSTEIPEAHAGSPSRGPKASAIQRIGPPVLATLLHYPHKAHPWKAGSRIPAV